VSTLTELLAETKAIVEFGDNASLEIQVTYESDRNRYLAKNGVGLFICGAAAENERLLPLIDSLLEALDLAVSDELIIEAMNKTLGVSDSSAWSTGIQLRHNLKKIQNQAIADILRKAGDR